MTFTREQIRDDKRREASATADMLRLTLACYGRPDDMRLNSHLTKSDIAENIRLAIETLQWFAHPDYPEGSA